MLTFHCIGCGHEHPQKPKGNVCESCGRATVVDLSALTAQELRQALDAPPASWRFRLRDVWGALILVATVSAFLTVSAIYLGRDRPKLEPGIESMLAQPSVDFTLPASEPADVPGWVALINGWLSELRVRSANLAPCVQGLEAGTDLLLRFSVGLDGTTSSIDVDRSGDRGRASECLSAAVAGWTFAPPTAGPVRVVVPYVVAVDPGGAATLSLPGRPKLVRR